MPTYLMLSTLTDQGLRTLQSNPDRLREVNRDVEELGARVLHQWTSLGTFDFVNIVEAPDAATIAKVSVALGAEVANVPLELCVHTRFGRTKDTARVALEGRDVPFETEPLLDDIDIGDLEGWSIEDYRRVKRELGRKRPFPGGESLDAAALR